MGNNSSTENVSFSVGDDSKVLNTPQRPRRIVKAAIPSPSSADNLTVSPDSMENRTEDDDESKPAEDPGRQERIQSMEKRHRAKREKMLQEKRNNPRSTAPKVEPNPFSRFLSVFSVEPAHPEHKRVFEGDSGIEEPEEKRLRPTDSLDEDEAKEQGIPSRLLLAAIAVAVAVVAAIHLKKKR